MKSIIGLGRIFGVRIGLHYSWFLVAVLVTLSLVVQFRSSNPAWWPAVIWGSAIATGILFFSALLAHELSHAIVAQSRGIPVREITLFALGGITHTEREPTEPRTEFIVAIVGPLTSALIGAVYLTAAWIVGGSLTSPASPLISILIWLGYINIIIAIFNLMPGFPLDGGRVLRAAVWYATGDLRRSTRISAGVGQVIAVGLILVGLFRVFAGAGLGGLWLVFIGWFLLDAARASFTQIQIKQALDGLRVSDVMSRDRPVIDSRLNLQTFVEDILVRTGQRFFIVEEKGHVVGILTPQEIKGIEQTRWPYTTISHIMRPAEKLCIISPDAPLAKALALMGQMDVNQLPVTRNGHVEGIISRGAIVGLLKNRQALPY